MKYTYSELLQWWPPLATLPKPSRRWVPTGGSLGAQLGNKNAFKHGHARTRFESRTWKSWRAMHERCYRPAAINYRLYGARGITVCDRWHDFRNFLADMGKRPIGYTIDRIDVDGNYEPSNCRWATPLEQQRNRRKKART